MQMSICASRDMLYSLYLVSSLQFISLCSIALRLALSIVGACPGLALLLASEHVYPLLLVVGGSVP